MKKQHKIIRNKSKAEENYETDNNEKIYEFTKAPTTPNIRSMIHVSKKSLGERLSKESSVVTTSIGGNREMKFTMREKKKKSDSHQKMKKHYEERKQIVRKAGFLINKKPRKFNS